MWRGPRSGGGIGRHGLACHHPVEQMLQRSRAELRGRRGSRAAQFLDVGRDVNARDVGELRHALGRKPIEKLRRGPRIGAARMRVANVGGEEFEEAIGSTGAGCRDESWSVIDGDGRKLVHKSLTQ